MYSFFENQLLSFIFCRINSTILCNIIIYNIQSRMKQEETTRIKYHKLTLKSLKIPPPPPYSKNLVIPTPKSKLPGHSSQSQQSQTHIQKQQATQKTQSSSQQQMYYENYFMLQVQNLIQQIIGNNAPYQIIELREGNASHETQDEVIDVAVRIGIQTGKQKDIKQRIRQLKQSSTGTSSKKHKTKQEDPPTKKYKIELQQQQTESTSTRNLKYPQQAKQINNTQLQYQQQVSSDQQKQEQHKKNIKLNESAFHINAPQQVNRKFKQDTDKIQESMNKKKRQKIVKKYYDQIDAADDEDNSNLKTIRRANSSSANSNKKFKNIHKILFAIIGLGIVLAIILLLISKITHSSQSYQSQQQESSNINTVEPLKQPTIVIQNRIKFPYQGNLENVPKYIYHVPRENVDETNNISVNLQKLRAVTKPEQSLHPMNLTYFRPAQAKLFTFPTIDYNDSDVKKSYILNMTHSQAQIKKYWLSLGNSQNQRVINLYKTLHKQNFNLSSLLLQTEYSYLNQKYGLDPHPIFSQKPLCLIHYTRNSYSTRQYIQFYTSLLQQNFTKFRLVHIEDNPVSKYESLRIMNYLWKEWKQKIMQVGISSFYFLQLEAAKGKQDNRVGRVYAKTAAVRQLCGDGDIVVQIEGLLLGRQALNIVSGLYDGGSERMSLIKKSLVKDYPYYSSKTTEISPNLQKQPISPQVPDDKQAAKIKPTISSDAVKQYSMQANQNKGSQTIKNNESKGNQGIGIDMFENSIFVGRVIGDVWALYSDYLYANKIWDTEGIEYKYINVTTQQDIYHNITRTLQTDSSKASTFLQSLSPLHLSATCLRSYIQPLQIKLPIQEPQSSTISKIQYFSTEQYKYDIQVYYRMLELSGRWGTGQKHHVEIIEPLCYRTDVKVLDQCEKKIKLYEEVTALSEEEFMPLQNILGEPIRVRQRNINAQNQIKQSVHTLIAKLRPQIMQACSKNITNEQANIK